MFVKEFLTKSSSLTLVSVSYCKKVEDYLNKDVASLEKAPKPEFYFKAEATAVENKGQVLH